MKIILISLSTRLAIGDYLYLLSQQLVKYEKIYLIVPDYFDKEVNAEKIVKINTSKNKFINFFKLINPFQIYKIFSEINFIKPDGVHIFFGEGYPLTLFLVFYLKIKRIPFIVTIHDPEAHIGNIIEKLNSFLRKTTLFLSSGIHLHSKIFIEEFKRFKDKIFIIPHGSFAPLFSNYFNKNMKKQNNILFFGRLEKYKGLEYFVKAGLKFKNIYNDFKFIIAGPGKINKKLFKIINENKNIFEFYNKYLSYEEIAYLFQKSKVLILPYTQVSQSSLPLIAAYFDVSVVASDLGGFKKDVSQINGVLFKPKDTEDLIQKIKIALNKKPFYPNELEYSNLVNLFLGMYDKFFHIN